MNFSLVLPWFLNRESFWTEFAFSVLSFQGVLFNQPHGQRSLSLVCNMLPIPWVILASLTTGNFSHFSASVTKWKLHKWRQKHVHSCPLKVWPLLSAISWAQKMATHRINRHIWKCWPYWLSSNIHQYTLLIPHLKSLIILVSVEEESDSQDLALSPSFPKL